METRTAARLARRAAVLAGEASLAGAVYAPLRLVTSANQKRRPAGRLLT